MTIKEMVIQYLKDNGYDGLYNDSGECVCTVDGDFPCGENFDDCEAGYLIEICAACAKRTEGEFMIDSNKDGKCCAAAKQAANEHAEDVGIELLAESIVKTHNELHAERMENFKDNDKKIMFADLIEKCRTDYGVAHYASDIDMATVEKLAPRSDAAKDKLIKMYDQALAPRQIITSITACIPTNPLKVHVEYVTDETELSPLQAKVAAACDEIVAPERFKELQRQGAAVMNKVWNNLFADIIEEESKATAAQQDKLAHFNTMVHDAMDAAANHSHTAELNKHKAGLAKLYDYLLATSRAARNLAPTTTLIIKRGETIHISADAEGLDND